MNPVEGVLAVAVIVAAFATTSATACATTIFVESPLVSAAGGCPPVLLSATSLPALAPVGTESSTLRRPNAGLSSVSARSRFAEGRSDQQTEREERDLLRCLPTSLPTKW